MSVKVAVRVRPFNGREKELNSKLCVEMVGNSTILTNPEDGKTKPFAFDFSFWSHDEFEEDEAGYFKATGSKYADQAKVYDLVGQEVLNNAWEGYHCCLFAYGQTGAGKSYSMVGYGANKGIVPISMKQIFERIGANTDPNLSYEVCFCMQEIYNEKIQDLLIPVKNRTPEGLKVREHTKYGVYVDGLSRHPVDSYDAIEAKMDEGSKNRTIGSTLMNASSSRAHTIMTIEFKKIEMISGKRTEKFAVINLVDLAGSEKISKTQASGDRLKEGCAINQSLSTLGLVISKLADKSMGKKNIVVPYRDSALTRILQNALGGNSKTLMICAISPATDNYEETLSTLRYADQAKKIKNNAVINESEQDKMIRELREENEKLKMMLGNYKPEEGMSNVRMVDEDTLRKFKEMEEQLKANAHMMEQYDKTFAEKLAEAKAKDKDAAEHRIEIDTAKPYLVNLNEDPLLSGKVLHSLTKERVLIGKKNADPAPDIVLGGIGIKKQHAEFINEEDNITIQPCDRECGEQLYVNGQKVYEPRRLYHNDRVIIGTNSTFIVKLPGKEEESPNKMEDHDIDWEFAQRELIELLDQEKKIKVEANSKEREKEVQEKIQSIEEKFIKERQQNDTIINKQKEEFERKLQEIEEKMKRDSEKQNTEIEKREAEREWKEQMAKYEADKLRKEKERERMQKEVQEEATLKRFKEQEKVHLEHKLAKHLSQITEVNLIAKELKRDVHFSVKLVYNFVSGAELQLFGQDKFAKTKIQVLVQNKETNNQYTWSMNKFTNRYFMIRDLLDQHYEGSKIPDKNTLDDPFWDPPEAHLVGQGFLCLESLGYLIDNPAELHIVSDNGTIGKLNVNIIPLDESGDPLNEDDDLIDDPTELISKRLDFLIQIENGEFIENLWQDTYCQYSLLKDDTAFEVYKTALVKGNIKNPEYNYKQQHTFESVSEKTLNYILNHNLKIQVFGNDYVEEKSLNLSSNIEKSAIAESNKSLEETLNTTTKTTGTGGSGKKRLQITTDFGDDNEQKTDPLSQPGNAVNTNKPAIAQRGSPTAATTSQTGEDNKARSRTTFAVNKKMQAAVTAATLTNQSQAMGKNGKTGGGKDKDKDCNMF